MKVSIRLMAYNHEAYIEEALDGINNQKTNFDFEVVVGDDFSTDNTLQKIKNYRVTNSRLYMRILERTKGDAYDVVRQEKGRLYNFVNIIEHCKGTYIALLDGDDYWIDPLKLQKQVDLLESDFNLIACHHWQKDAIERGGVFKEVDSVKDGYGYYPNLVSGVKHIFSNQMRVKTRTVMFRNIITDTFFPDWFYTLAFGDVPLSYLLGQYGDFGFIDEEMAVYRRIETGASRAGLKELGRQKYNIEHFKNWIDIWDRANNLYKYAYKQEAFSTVSSFYGVIFKNMPLRLRTLKHLLVYNHRRNLPLGMRLRRSFWIVVYFFKQVKQRLLAKLQ